MTVRELCQKFQIRLHIFEDDEYEDEAFYIPGLQTMFISSSITEDERVKVALHELGHKGHLPHLYEIFREKYEMQANRNMIHHLLKAEMENCEDYSHFNYLVFMEKYKLKTIADEAMVKEEYYNLVSGY
ncbi:TPA: ImmA/IrrE family metallo-endopeptidase [Streptococcus suis]